MNIKLKLLVIISDSLNCLFKQALLQAVLAVRMEAFVTLATNDSYCLGALTVAASLRAVKTSRKIVCMITPQVTDHMR